MLRLWLARVRICNWVYQRIDARSTAVLATPVNWREKTTALLIFADIDPDKRSAQPILQFGYIPLFQTETLGILIVDFHVGLFDMTAQPG